MADASPANSSVSVSVAEVRRIPERWLRIERYSLQVSVDGMARQLDRVVCGRGDRIAVLPYSPERATILLVRVMRMGPVLHDPDSPLLVEAPGGLLEGAAPEAAAATEVQEETGCRVDGLEAVASVYLAPHLSAERTHLYLGEYHEEPRLLTRIDAEGEVCQLLELPLKDACRSLLTGETAADGKTLLLLAAARRRWLDPARD